MQFQIFVQTFSMHILNYSLCDGIIEDMSSHHHSSYLFGRRGNNLQLFHCSAEIINQDNVCMEETVHYSWEEIN